MQPWRKIKAIVVLVTIHDDTLERIRDAKAAQRRTGRSTNGRARLGYRLLPGGYLRPDARQRRIHRSIAVLRTRGWCLREIAEHLNRTWRRRPGARRWNCQAVSRPSTPG